MMNKIYESWRKGQKTLLKEVSQGYVDDVLKFMKKAKPSDYPFNDMFGGQWRIVLPLENSIDKALDSGHVRGIRNGLQLVQFRQIAHDMGWTIEFDNGIGYKIEKQTNPKTGETIDRRVEAKIGKLIGRLTQEAEKAGKNKEVTTLRNFQNIWNTQAEQIQANKSMVIISQHPIDVLRMSDFRGIESCHSEGGGYFECAIEEAQAHGPIAYVVRAADIEKYKDRLQEDEFFGDDQWEDDDGDSGEMHGRGLPGPVPIARLRLREILDKKTGIRYPAPERVVYGNPIPGFEDVVMQWAQSKKGDETSMSPNLNDYKMLGGHYRDTDTDELLYKYAGKRFENYDEAAVRRKVEALQKEWGAGIVEASYNRDYWQGTINYPIIQIKLPCNITEMARDEFKRSVGSKAVGNVVAQLGLEKNVRSVNMTFDTRRSISGNALFLHVNPWHSRQFEGVEDWKDFAERIEERMKVYKALEKAQRKIARVCCDIFAQLRPPVDPNEI